MDNNKYLGKKVEWTSDGDVGYIVAIHKENPSRLIFIYSNAHDQSKQTLFDFYNSKFTNIALTESPCLFTYQQAIDCLKDSYPSDKLTHFYVSIGNIKDSTKSSAEFNTVCFKCGRPAIKLLISTECSNGCK
jgi:hypothetical protein